MTAKKLFLVRGIPGSAKSTIASQLSNGGSMYHYEADNFFYDDHGNYNYDPAQIKAAHQWCQKMTDLSLKNGSVVVANTFTTLKELRPYFEIAKKHGIVPNVVLAQNNFKNTHNVPEATLVAMKQRFVYDISPLFEEFYPE